jgi:phytol kinase
MKTGYTRKVFHFLIFGSVALIQWLWGTQIVCLFGGMTTLVVFYAVFRGPGNMLYEAMAREKDEPHRTHYIVVAYFATLIGGLASNIMFGEIAVIGYLVTGFGDAIGEPVGTRFGKHTYRAPSFTSVEPTRSYEGSLAVLVACMLAVVLGIALCPALDLTARSLLLVPVLGVACAVGEAVSPHGWDNTTMLIVPSLLAWWLLAGS